MAQVWRTPAATAATEPRPSMLDATVGERRRTINLLVQTPDQADFDRLEDGQVILRERDDKSLEGDAGRDKAPARNTARTPGACTSKTNRKVSQRLH